MLILQKFWRSSWFILLTTFKIQADRSKKDNIVSSFSILKAPIKIKRALYRDHHLQPRVRKSGAVCLCPVIII